jgi:competence protein ComEC
VATDRAAFEEDCARAAVLVSALTAPAECRAEVFDERRLALTGAVGLVWDGARFVVSADRSALEDRPWSPAPKRSLPDRLVRPGQSDAKGAADPADPPADIPE